MAVIDLALSARQRHLHGPRHRSPPPRPHDPRERILVDTCAPDLAHPTYRHWEVRQFDPAGIFHCYFGDHGMLHLQLWHPWSGVSLLTPSRLTAGRYEVFPSAGWKLADRDYSVVATAVRREHGVALPSAERLDRLCREHGLELGSASPARRPLSTPAEPAHSRAYRPRAMLPRPSAGRD